MNDLAIFENPQALEQAITFAERIASSGLLPNTLQKRPQDILVILLTGRELGLPPMASLQQIAVVQGKPVMSSALCRSLALRHQACEYFECVEQTATVATWKTKRRGGDEQKISFTIEDAKRAGLAGKDNWQKYPAAMLSARASAILARNAYPDILGGVYVDEEREELEVRDMTPPPKPASGAKAAVMASLNAQLSHAQPELPRIPSEVPGIQDAELVDAKAELVAAATRVQEAIGGQLSILGADYAMQQGAKKGHSVKSLDGGALQYYAKGTGADAEAAKGELKERGVK